MPAAESLLMSSSFLLLFITGIITSIVKLPFINFLEKGCLIIVKFYIPWQESSSTLKINTDILNTSKDAVNWFESWYLAFF